MRQRLGIAKALLGERWGSAWRTSGDGGFRSEADPIDVGRVAAAAGIVLMELRRA
jgi:ABC-2 type transport system ATP-binding protein